MQFSSHLPARLAVTTFASVLSGRARYVDDHSEATIWYLGSDYARWLELQDRFGARCVPLAQAVNAAAQALLPLILDLDGALATPGLNREAWNASDFAERSRFNSPFLLEASRVMAFLRGADAPGHYLAVTDDESFALGVFDTAVANGHAIAWIGAARPVLRLRHAGAASIAAIKRTLGEMRAALRRRTIIAVLRKKAPLTPEQVRSIDVWIVVWATNKTFTPGAVLENEDRAGRLPGLLRAGGLRVGYIALPLWPERYGEMAGTALQCAEPLLSVEDGLTLGDLLRACWMALRPLPGVKRGLFWNGTDLGAIVRRAVAHERTSGRPIRVRQLVTIPRLLQQLGASPKAIVTTYENHSWEKVLTGAVREYLPSTRVAGNNHALVSPFYVSMNPSPGDIAANAIPDCVMTLGALTGDDLAARGFPRDRLTVAGGLRFEEFFKRARQIPLPPETGVRTVLCCVGVDLNEGLELVHKGAQAVAGNPGLALLVNFHPMSGRDFRDAVQNGLRTRGIEGFDSIRFDDRPVRELLAQAHAVLYIDSNAALEAAAAGRQIIYVMRETGIDYDKMPDGLAQRCRTPADIRAALEVGNPLRRAEVDALLARCIAPVDSARILQAVRG